MKGTFYVSIVNNV